jgi:hypothetical protein
MTKTTSGNQNGKVSRTQVTSRTRFQGGNLEAATLLVRGWLC